MSADLLFGCSDMSSHWGDIFISTAAIMSGCHSWWHQLHTQLSMCIKHHITFTTVHLIWQWIHK